MIPRAVRTKEQSYAVNRVVHNTYDVNIHFSQKRRDDTAFDMRMLTAQTKLRLSMQHSLLSTFVWITSILVGQLASIT